MWQRFTEPARKAVWAAQEEARRLNDAYVTPEHLLFGLLSVETNVACYILRRMDVAPQAVRLAIERQADENKAAPNKKDIQLTPRAKRVIDLAYDEARQLSNNYIGTEHLLLALVREENSGAGRALAAQGGTLERTRREVMALQDNDAGQSTPDAPPAASSAVASSPSEWASRLPRSTAATATATAAQMLFDREFRKLSPELRQALQTDGLPLSELPHTFYVVLKVVMEAWNTQEAVVLDSAGRLRVQQSENGGKLVYNVQTDATLISTLLIAD